MALDSGFRRNDKRLGAIHRAPTQKTYPYQPLRRGTAHSLLCALLLCVAEAWLDGAA